MANRPELDEICSTTFSTAYAHLFTCHAFTNTVNYLHVVRKQEDCIRLDCNRDAVRLNYCQLERVHARARVDMSMLATGKMAFRVESGLIVRPSLSLGENGSIGEGPNHSNYSDQRSVRIRPELRRFC